MIIDVPTSDEFRHAGIAYLNLAWSSTLELALNLDEACVEEWDDTGTVPDKYWQSAQRPLATAVSLLQQGAEFLIKSCIAEVSPFLLLDGSPRDWPRHCNQNDTPFSAFKTIDAQDLIRAHDTAVASRLTAAFIDRYERLRSLRNTVMHTIDPRLRFTATEVVVSILEVSENLIGPQSWLPTREQFLNHEPNSIASSADHVEPVLARECLKVIDMLQPAMLRKFFGFNPRQRRYHCYNCQLASADWGLDVTTAQLQPNMPASTNVYCFVCRKNASVVRQPCPNPECRGNVIEAEDKVCLTCYK